VEHRGVVFLGGVWAKWVGTVACDNKLRCDATWASRCHARSEAVDRSAPPGAAHNRTDYPVSLSAANTARFSPGGTTPTWVIGNPLCPDESGYAWSTGTSASTIPLGLGAGGVQAMRYFAVSAMPPGTLSASLRHRRYWTAGWHSVSDTSSNLRPALCGLRYTSEAHRICDRTRSGSQFPQCQRKAMTSYRAEDPTFIAEAATAAPDSSQPREPVSRRAFETRPFRIGRRGGQRRSTP
jgi:hypothetical protein